jgi:hypothetical protein
VDSSAERGDEGPVQERLRPWGTKNEGGLLAEFGPAVKAAAPDIRRDQLTAAAA